MRALRPLRSHQVKYPRMCKPSPRCTIGSSVFELRLSILVSCRRPSSSLFRRGPWLLAILVLSSSDSGRTFWCCVATRLPPHPPHKSCLAALSHAGSQCWPKTMLVEFRMRRSRYSSNPETGSSPYLYAIFAQSSNFHGRRYYVSDRRCTPLFQYEGPPFACTVE